MRRFLVCLVAVAALAAPAAAQATTIVVNTTAPEIHSACGLISAVAAVDSEEPRAACPAGGGGTPNRIEFALPLPATIELTEAGKQLQISKDVEIAGPGAGLLTVSGGSVSRVFEALRGNITISGLTIAHGQAQELGAGLFVQGPANVTLAGVVMRENEVRAITSSVNPFYGAGGAILNEGNLALVESTVTGNVARNTDPATKVHALGGGIANGEGQLLIDRSTVSGNLAEIANSGGEANAKGGGIYNLANLTVRASTISGNEAKAVGVATNAATGGGINTESGGLLTIERSTIAGNVASAPSLTSGGGIADLGPNASVDSSTFAGNSAATGADILGSATTTVADSILARPVSGASCSAALTSAGHNLDEGSSCGFAQSGDLSGVDPGLAPTLAANGGPTATLALLAGSPAIDSGLATGETADQRGYPRPVAIPGLTPAAGSDGSDIGAFEVQVPRVTITRGPAEGQTIGEATPTFEFTSDAPTSGFLCAFDGAAPTPCASPLVAPALANGPHSFYVVAEGEDGYRAEGVTRKFDVDVRPAPVVPAEAPKQGGSSQGGSKQQKPKVAPRVRIGKLPATTTARRLKVRFTSNQAGVRFQCRFEGHRWRSCHSPWLTPRLSIARHVIRVRAIGTTGLLGPPATKKVRVVAPATR